MIQSKYEWNVLSPSITKDKDIFPVILKNRQIADLYEFFHRGKESLHHPSLLKDIEIAKSRIIQAIASNQKIVVFGDYDCDGITSTSVMVRALTKLGANVEFDVPDRFLDGYGLNQKAVQEMIENSVSLVITVDNGITCIEEVKTLKAAGIDTIITDHHEPKHELPDAFAIIHPKCSETYPFKELAGVGVAYKLATYLLEDDFDEVLDLVMIGTIADMMPLVDENQAIVNLGMEVLRHTKNIGLRKIVQHSHLDILNETAIAFKIAPKINSSGRMNKAKDAVSLLTTQSESEASRLIIEIEQNHLNRKDLTDEAYLLCEGLLNSTDTVLVVASEDLHEGIIGICAQKLVEKYQKTTCVIYIDEAGIGKGSMRAFGEDNALELLSKSEKYLSRFGGHAQAAGLQLPKEHIDAFRKRLNEMAKSSHKPTLQIDMEVQLRDVQIKTVLELEEYSFFTAKFLLRQLVIKNKQKMSEKHTKLMVSDGVKQYDAVLFNSTEYYYALNIGDQVDIVGGLSVNTWKNNQRLQIMIKDLACHHQQFLDFRAPKFFFEAKEEIILGNNACIINDEVILSSSEPIESLLNKSTIWITPASMLLDLHKYSTRAGLLELYRLLQSQKTITISQLLTKLHIHPLLLKSLLDVFAELNLITLSDDVITYCPTFLKQDLETSKAFQDLKAKQLFINQLYTIETQQLTKWFQKYMEEHS